MINGEEDDVMPMPVLHSFSPSIVNCMRNLTTELKLNSDTNLDEQAWNCLGCILSNNSSVTKLNISLCNLDVSWLFSGLQYNKNIKEFRFYGIDLEDAEKMKSLAPFLSNNSSLTDITLSHCNIGTDTIDILTNALANRTADTLKILFLDGNNLGVCNLDGLVTALSTCTRLAYLRLDSNGIGQSSCTHLAQLLKSPESNLTDFHLSNNLIDDEGVEILSASLVNNTKLRTLALYGNKITGSGWKTLLKLVCDTSSMAAVKESNHTLTCLGIYGDKMQAAVVSALGVDEANLLFASLKLNKNCRSRKLLIIRQKTIWAHARGDINIAGSDIPDSAMPIILSWFGDYSNEKTAHLIKYHDPPLPQEKVNTKRLDSLYRIICDMPELCQNDPKSDADVKKSKLCLGRKVFVELEGAFRAM